MTELSAHLSRLIRDDERVLWHAQPDRRAYYAGMALALTITGGIFAAAGAGVAVAAGGIAGLVSLAGTVPATAWAAGLAGLLVAAGLAVRRSHALVEYAVTDDRVLETGGLLGRDTSTVSLDDVTDVDVNRSLIGRLCGTGRLTFQTAGGGAAGVQLVCVQAPYEVLDVIEEARDRAGRAQGPRSAGQAGARAVNRDSCAANRSSGTASRSGSRSW